MSETRELIYNTIIEIQTERKGVAPTYDEISERVGKGKSTVSHHVNMLTISGHLLRFGERITVAAGEWRVPGECRWKQWADYDWEAECGLFWIMEAEGPAENNMNYCPKCGRKLVEEDND